MKRSRRCKAKGPVFLRSFPRYSQITAYLKEIAQKHPKHVCLEQIGKSYQGRPIYLIIIRGDRKNPKSSVMIEAGIHAREWLGHTTALYIIDYVITHKKMLDVMDFLVVPCLNPDGYEYTHTNCRLWRKNMNPNGSKNRENWGVDINRNFSFGYWCPEGSSNIPSAFNYRGKGPLSEPEAQSLACALNRHSRSIKLYIAIHCYGHLIMYPWGFTTKPLPDRIDLRKCAKAAVTAMKTGFPRSSFRIGCMSRVMWSVDFARGTYKIKFSFTIELHKEGKSGFEPKPSKIVSAAEEAWLGIKAMIYHVAKYYTFKCKRKQRRPPV